MSAVLLFRIAENRRRRPDGGDPVWVRYASCFAAMQMGQRLLNDLGGAQQITHQNFEKGRALIEERGRVYFEDALRDIEHALKQLYGDREVSLQQLAATFRRADLIANLEAIAIG